MDERWQCPHCGFHNNYQDTYCVSCNAPRSDDELDDEAPEDPMDGLVFTSYLRELDYEPKPLDLPLYAPRPDYEESSKPIPGSVPMPTLEPLTSPPPATRPTRPGLDELAKRIEKLRRAKSPSSGSPPRRMVPKLMIFIALAGIAGAIAANFADRNDTTSVTNVTTSIPIVVNHEDDAYFEELTLVNEARNALVDITNDRWDAWLELESDEFPTSQYLVVDELEAFQVKVQSMTAPVSAEARALHDTWTTNLEVLVSAEKTLVTEPSQGALDAELDAWNTEDASYTELYEYMQARD